MHKVAEGRPPIFSAKDGGHGVNACAGQKGIMCWKLRRKRGELVKIEVQNGWG